MKVSTINKNGDLKYDQVRLSDINYSRPDETSYFGPFSFGEITTFIYSNT